MDRDEVERVLAMVFLGYPIGLGQGFDDGF